MVKHWHRSSERVGTCGIAASAVAVCAMAWLAVPMQAAAQSVRGDVLVIFAQEVRGAIDPELEAMNALKKPPFNAFRSMKVETRHKLALPVGKADKTITLPNAHRLRINVLRKMPDGRFEVRSELLPKADKSSKASKPVVLTVAASPGTPFFVAGQHHRHGTLIIAVTLN